MVIRRGDQEYTEPRHKLSAKLDYLAMNQAQIVYLEGLILWAHSLYEGSNGQEELPHVQGQGRQPRGATSCPRSGVVAERNYPTSKIRSSGYTLLEQPWRDTPDQSKRNPSKTVGVVRGHQRADTLKPYSQKTSQSDHTDHRLVLLNETKLCRVGPPKMGGSWWRGLTECGPLKKGMANHFSFLALRTPWTVWKGEMMGYWKGSSLGR